MIRKSYCEIKNFAINASSSGEFIDYGKYTGVNYLTNIMSVLTNLGINSFLFVVLTADYEKFLYWRKKNFGISSCFSHFEDKDLAGGGG